MVRDWLWLESRIEPEPMSGCWLWVGTVDKAGYGRLVMAGKGCTQTRSAHREVYENLRGVIPENLTLDHLCRTRCCVNPAHLEPVSQKENVRRGRGVGVRRTHCPRGHPYDEVNTYIAFRATGLNRHCRVCRRIVDARRYPRRKSPMKTSNA